MSDIFTRQQIKSIFVTLKPKHQTRKRIQVQNIYEFIIYI
jgi:hypothetical protein